jgi:DNA-directed RNA polymerase subunit omega
VVQNYWATFYFPVFNVKSLIIILCKTSVSPEFVNNIIGKTNIRFEEREFDRKLANRHAELGFWKKCRIIQNITHRMEVLFVARITIEDCLKKVSNRFLLVKMVSQRVKQIREGSDYLVSSPKNEDVVVALREVAAGKIKMIEKEEAET